MLGSAPPGEFFLGGGGSDKILPRIDLNTTMKLDPRIATISMRPVPSVVGVVDARGSSIKLDEDRMGASFDG